MMNNIPVRKLDFDEDEKKVIKPFALITAKPIIYMANIDEESLKNNGNKYTDMVRGYAEAER